MSSSLGRAVLIGLALASIVLVAALVYPFASALLFAAVLAGSFVRWTDWLSRRLGGRRPLAAGLVTGAVAVLIVIPLAILVAVLAKETVEAVGYVRDTLRRGGLPSLVHDLPPPLRAPAYEVLAYLPQRGGPIEELGRAPAVAAATMGGVLVTSSRVLLEIGLMLVAFYFLLLDGRGLVDWLGEVAPIGRARTRELLSHFRSVSEAVLLSSLGTAGAQAVVALAGFLVAGVPQPFFFALVTFIVGFVPVLGASFVTVSLAAGLYLAGQLGSAGALALGLWGVLAVGLTDNLVKPLLLRDRMEIHGAVIFFALVGGLATFGLVGLAAGPLIVSFFLATARMCRHDIQERTAA